MHAFYLLGGRCLHGLRISQETPTLRQVGYIVGRVLELVLSVNICAVSNEGVQNALISSDGADKRSRSGHFGKRCLFVNARVRFNSCVCCVRVVLHSCVSGFGFPMFFVNESFGRACLLHVNLLFRLEI